MKMQNVAPEDFQRPIFQEFERAGGAEEDKGSAGTRIQDAQVDKNGNVKGRGQGLCKGWSHQGQQDSGPEPTTIPPLVRAHLPWPLTQTM